jgi:hypothetical protein
MSKASTKKSKPSGKNKGDSARTPQSARKADALTLKQEKFVLEYARTPNATIAVIKAGYSKNGAAVQGERLLRNAKVQNALESKRQKLAAQAERTALDVFNDIVEVTIQAKAKGDLKNALRGLELQGKHLGMFTDKIQAEMSGELLIRWRDK